MTEQRSDESGSTSLRAAGLIVSWFTATGLRKPKKPKETKILAQSSIRQMRKKEQRTRFISEYCRVLILQSSIASHFKLLNLVLSSYHIL